MNEGSAPFHTSFHGRMGFSGGTTTPHNLKTDGANDFNGSGVPDNSISIGNIDLNPSSIYTLYLWGDIDGSGFGSGSIFTPVNGDVTFDLLNTGTNYLEVDFTTSASWDDGPNDTIDFIWGDNSSAGGWIYFAGFAIVGGAAAPIPEPAGLGLMGLALLAVRKRRS
jgi:hypothetical protein